MYFLYYYPVGFDQPRDRPPLVTSALLVLMAVGFAWWKWFPHALPLPPWRLVYLGGSAAPWAAVTAVLLHGGWLHLLGNMLYVAVLGPPIEDQLGHARFLLYFLMLGAWGNVTHGVFTALNGGTAGVLGASGAIAGLLAIALVRFYYARVAIAWWVFAPLQGVNRVGRAHVPVVIAALIWLLLQVVEGLVAREAGARVAYAAHFGGFALGLFLALALGWHREAQTASRLARARRFLDRGQVWAAEGELVDYLRARPHDLDAALRLARARRMTGRAGDASTAYRRALTIATQAGRLDSAAEVWREARRGGCTLAMPAEQLAQMAFLFEKQGDYRGAVEAFLDLYRFHRSDRRAEFALTRAVVLLRGRLQDSAAARDWLEVVRCEFPSGLWRDFLEAEVRPERGPRAMGPAGAAGPRTASAT